MAAEPLQRPFSCQVRGPIWSALTPHLPTQPSVQTSRWPFSRHRSPEATQQNPGAADRGFVAFGFSRTVGNPSYAEYCWGPLPPAFAPTPASGILCRPGPFVLTNYAQAVRRALTINSTVALSSSVRHHGTKRGVANSVGAESNNRLPSLSARTGRRAFSNYDGQCCCKRSR